MPQSLQIKIDSVSLSRDTASIGFNMNVYVKAMYGGETFKTAVIFDGGKECSFGDTKFDFGDGTKSEMLPIKVFDKGTFSDEEVGHCVVCLDELKVGTGVTKDFTLLFENKEAGKVFITSFYDEGEKTAEIVEQKQEPAKAAPAIAPPQPALQPPAPMPQAAPAPYATPGMMPGQAPMMGGMQPPMMGGMP